METLNTNNKTFWAGGFLYNPQTKEVMMHFRDGKTNVNPYKWGFFGGSSEENETPAQCFIRELKEELNIAFEPEELISLDSYVNEEQMTMRNVFCVQRNNWDNSLFSLREGGGFAWIPLDKIFDYDLSSKSLPDLKKFFSESISKLPITEK